MLSTPELTLSESLWPWLWLSLHSLVPLGPTKLHFNSADEISAKNQHGKVSIVANFNHSSLPPCLLEKGGW